MKIKSLLTSIFVMFSSLALAEETKHIYDTTESDAKMSLISEEASETEGSSVEETPAEKPAKAKKTKAAPAAKVPEASPEAPIPAEPATPAVTAPTLTTTEQAPVTTGAPDSSK